MKIPEYHSQFYRFRGYAFFEAEDPKKLPWNTAKTNIDLDSAVWRAAFQQMVLLMRSVIDFLNRLHDEAGHFQNDRINETPLKDAVSRAKIVSLSIVREDSQSLSMNRFVYPPPAKQRKSKPTEISIRFKVPKEKYDLVRKYFDDVDDASDIGLRIFDYFFKREIEE